MKTKLFLIVSCMIVFFSINACSKEAIEDCLYGSGMGCAEVPIPLPDDGLLVDGQIKTDAILVESDSPLAVSKLPVRD